MPLKEGLEYLSYAVNLALAASWTWRIARDSIARRSVQTFMGKGEVNIYLVTRIHPSGRRVIANEDFFASLELADFLRRHGLQCDLREIDPSEDVDFEENSVVICGPKSSKFVQAAYEQDPNYGFELRDDTWMLLDRATGNYLTSPLDRDPPEEKDLAYLGRASNRSGRPYLLLAGLHAIGSYGAVRFLSDRENIRWLLRKAKQEYFSTVLVTKFDMKSMKILRTDILLALRCH